MDIELAAIHEAGHAVMQWFVGLELGDLQITVVDGKVTKASTRCPQLPLPTLSDLRRRLLVLLAGNAVTLERWPNSWNDRGDWEDILRALWKHYQRPMRWDLIDPNASAAERYRQFCAPSAGPTPVHGRKVADPEATEVLQDAITRCREIIMHELFQKAVDRVASALIAAPQGEDGVRRLEGPAAVAICEEVIGSAFRQNNPWSAWLDGKDRPLGPETSREDTISPSKE